MNTVNIQGLKPTEQRVTGPSRHHVTYGSCFKKIEESPENDKILSLMLADEVQRIRKIRNPSAEEILESLA